MIDHGFYAITCKKNDEQQLARWGEWSIAFFTTPEKAKAFLKQEHLLKPKVVGPFDFNYIVAYYGGLEREKTLSAIIDPSSTSPEGEGTLKFEIDKSAYIAATTKAIICANEAVAIAMTVTDAEQIARETTKEQELPSELIAFAVKEARTRLEKRYPPPPKLTKWLLEHLFGK